jgi:hypothetical protein
MPNEWREMLGCVAGLALTFGALGLVVCWVLGMADAVTEGDSWRIEGIHPVVQAAEVAAQRHTGREWGSPITVDWKPGKAFEVDAYAQFIMEQGADVGVKLNIVGDAENSRSDGARQAARSYRR